MNPRAYRKVVRRNRDAIDVVGNHICSGAPCKAVKQIGKPMKTEEKPVANV